MGAGICKLPSDPILLERKADADHRYFRSRNKLLFGQLSRFLNFRREEGVAAFNILGIGAGPACFSRDLPGLCAPLPVKVMCLETNDSWHPF